MIFEENIGVGLARKTTNLILTNTFIFISYAIRRESIHIFLLEYIYNIKNNSGILLYLQYLYS